jgi:hypothetical protein
MGHLCSTVVRCWGTRPTLRLGGYLWVAGMFGLLAGEPHRSISGAPFRGHPDHSHVIARYAGRSTVCVDCGLGLRGRRGNGSQFVWQQSRNGGARHDLCVCLHQSDSRLPSSGSRPHPFRSYFTRVIGFLCWSCFLSPPSIRPSVFVTHGKSALLEL